MLKQYSDILRRIIIIFDMFLVVIASALAYLFLCDSQELFSPVIYLWAVPVICGIWAFCLYCFGIYDSFRLKTGWQIVGIILQSAVWGFFIFCGINYLIMAVFLNRLLIALTFGFTAGLLIAEKIGLFLMFQYLRRKGLNFRNVIIVGTGQRACAFIRSLTHHREVGFRIVGIVDEDVDAHGKMVEGYPILGGLNDLSAILRQSPVDRVIFVVPRTWLSQMEEAVLTCETLGITVSIAVDLFTTKFTHAREENLLNVPMISFQTTSNKVGQLMFKRLLDFIIAAVGMILLMPLFGLIAVLVKLTSPGPVFFRQERCSLNGRRFTLYKFRTMVVDAESRLKQLQQYNEMSGPAFKMQNDPRITTLGKFLRTTSLDELPQLCNVLKGDMSLVGPRPPLPSEVEQYDHWQRRRLSMRPGITCLWQIKGRNKITDFNEWMRLDLEYIDNWSLVYDLRILAQTVPVVLFAVGAK